MIRELPYRVFVDRELDRMACLPANWDAEGSVPIDPAIIQAARDFIARLPDNLANAPAVVPRSEGNLQFEWNDGPRSLELEIETPQTIHYLKWSPAEAIKEEGIFPIDDIGRAVLLIDWIAKGLTRV